MLFRLAGSYHVPGGTTVVALCGATSGVADRTRGKLHLLQQAGKEVWFVWEPIVQSACCAGNEVAGPAAAPAIWEE